MHKGIAIAGNMLVDNVKAVRTYPKAGMLADIVEVSRSVGGCVPNTLLDIARMRSGIPLTAIGKVGRDGDGRYIIERLKEDGVDVSKVVTSDTLTSFSDAMSAQDSGERTFFHFRGANAAFSPADVDLDALECDLLHVGYVLLLDAFDQRDSQYGTVMARFLHDAQQKGILTSIDAVSDSEGRFAEIVTPALRYCDYAIMNEIEGCAVSGLAPRDEQGRILVSNIEKTLRQFIEHGVRRRAVIHCPEAGFCMDAQEGFAVVPSLDLPKGYIQGSVGAGDAFCAGCLHEIYQGASAEQMLEYASAAAAANLSAADSVSGMKCETELRKMMKEWRRKAL